MASYSSTFKMKCGLLYVQSVRNKTFEIRNVINDEDLDIFAITETWLSHIDSAVINELTPDTHNFFHNPRCGQWGGRVGLFLTEI